MTFTFSPHIFLISVLLIFCSVNIVPSQGQCLPDQKTLLLETKNSLTFDHSASAKLVQWNPDDDCCSWTGIECDVSGHVISLDLESGEISGGIQNSTSLFSLQYLKKLNLAYNRFSDVDIPREIGNLARLTHLNLSHAGFFGQIPRELSRLENLVSLDLSTPFDGKLKLENPNLKTLFSNLRGLKELNLDGVNISAPGNEWCKDLSSSLHNLRILSLRGCYLSGPLHSSLANLHSLSVLRLDLNNLAEEVPKFLTNFSKLETLSLSSCSLLGIFPEKIFQVPTLKNLDLSNNMELSGTLPRFLQGGSLRNVFLGYTNFSGSLPNSISNLVNLSSLNLFNCSFSGPIPPTLSNLTELSYLYLSYNYFTGSLSSSHFEGLTNLVDIDLGRNLLTGNIPSSLFALPSLKRLYLSYNKFDGRVDEFLNASDSLLETIDLRSNRLNGTIPKFFFQLDRLEELSLSSNSFSGNFQLEMFKSPNRSILDLSYNDLVIDSIEPPPLFHPIEWLGLASCGLQKFPGILKNSSSIYYLDLSSNQIKGEIPNWIWELRNLEYLNLSFNLLTGFQTPYNILKLTSLYTLDLKSNQLQGELPIPPVSSWYVDYSDNRFNKTIPQHIGTYLSIATFFSASNNSLTGSIPTSICNATSLEVLDLSSNSLTDGIPHCLTNENIIVLSLGGNDLSGKIPDTFPVICNLQTLDLNKNALQGKIPRSLSHCKSLEFLNVGNNMIQDTFPCMMNMDVLRVLVLRSNRFHSNIQCLGEWSNLQIIDISANNFTGDVSRIPLSKWVAMASVNDGKKSNGDQILRLENYNYQDTVTVTIKGSELELTKIRIIFTTIDFSRNKFYGKIPDTIGDLKSLYLLNLSHNAVTGNIPASLGKLTQLNSLDLSTNFLTGKIPTEIASLTFLSVLNLSHNKLFGEIPTGRQLQTFSPVSYEGNVGLCGFPLNVSCNKIEVEGGLPSNLDDDDGEIEWEYVSAAVGFIVGLGSVVWMLLCYGRWRKIYFEKIDEILIKVFPMLKWRTKR